MRGLLHATVAAFTALSEPALADQKKPKATTSETKQMAALKDDQTFAMQMMQHHRDGIAMADAVIANGSSDDVKAMARRIKTDQQKDVTMLTKQMGNHASHHMSAMAPKDPDMERGMAQLKAAKGADADRLFLELMITHHASGLMMAHSAMPNLTGAQKTMANDMFAKQAREIGELQTLRQANRSASR